LFKWFLEWRQEGGAKLTRTTTTLPAGTVVTFRTAPFAFANPDNNWLVSDLFVHPTTPNNSVLAGDFNINSGGDQLYIAQGGTWTEQASLCTINGTRTSPNAIFRATMVEFYLAFQPMVGKQMQVHNHRVNQCCFGMNCFSMSPTNGTAWNKYNLHLLQLHKHNGLNELATTAIGNLILQVIYTIQMDKVLLLV
jgi:hypothetical protein